MGSSIRSSWPRTNPRNNADEAAGVPLASARSARLRIAVEHAGQSAPAVREGLDLAGAQQLADPEPPEIVPLELRHRLERAAGGDRRANVELADGLRGEDEQPPAGRLDPHRDLAVLAPGHGGDVAADLDLAPGRKIEGAGVDRRDPRRADRQPERARSEGQGHEPGGRPGAAPSPDRGERDERRDRHREQGPAAARPERPGEGEPDGQALRGRGGASCQGWSRSRSASIVAGPMPLI